MSPRQLRSTFAVITLAALLAVPATAGQVRVNVSNFAFAPVNPTVDVGDHVVWIWTGGSHTVTSGTNDGSTGTPNGRFAAGTQASPPMNATFSWKTTTVRGEPYFCYPHIAFGMDGTVSVVASGATTASDFRITEVQFAGGEDRVEIANLGATGDLGKYRLKVSGQTLATLQIGSSTNIALAAGGRMVLHFGVTGTNTATDLFFSAVSLSDASGSVALYVPNTTSPLLTDATQLIDFVQWGASAQENEATANTAGYWAAGASINGVAPGHSVEFCGTPGQYGSTFWSEVAVPNFGSNGGCSTPTVRSTWGRVKTLYR